MLASDGLGIAGKYHRLSNGLNNRKQLEPRFGLSDAILVGCEGPAGSVG
jgi:hypothetical protein